MENGHRRETDSEMSLSLRPATPLGPGDGIHLSPPSLRIAVAPINIPGQEPCPPSQTTAHPDGENSPFPRDLEMNGLDDINREPRADGEESRVDGGGPQADGGRPRADGEEPQSNKEGPRPDEEGPQVDEEGPQVDEEGPRVDEEEPLANEGGPQTGGEGPQADEEAHTDEEERRAEEDERRTEEERLGNLLNFTSLNPYEDSDEEETGGGNGSGDEGGNGNGDEGGNGGGDGGSDGGGGGNGGGNGDDDNGDEPTITRKDMKTTLQFIQMLEEATLDTQFSPRELEAFQNPQEILSSPSDNPDLLLSISNYVANLNASQDIYIKNRLNTQRRSPEIKMLSYDQVQRRVSRLSGVVTWQHDMCIDSCVGFTGPYAELDHCPHPRCRKPRYDQRKLEKSGGKNKVPLKTFATFPIGPQLQSRWKSPDMAQKMHYRRNKTADILREHAEGTQDGYDDILGGYAYLDAVEDGRIGDHDTVLMLSMDGAQLLRNKKSDCWIYIWILLDLGPDERYKVRNIIPGGIIPGPGKPKDIDSFLFPGLAHVSALQNEGLHIWDGYDRVAVISFLFLLLVLADAVAMAELSGSVGHHGKRGCRLMCSFSGRNKPGGSHYYPVLLRPLDSDAPGSNHLDVDICSIYPPDAAEYRRDLNLVLASPTNAEYGRRRLETGIKKASIFDGIPRILELPTCFPGDIMHQPVINLTTLMFELWCERGHCRTGDESNDIWDWAVLKGDVWKAHGQAVADAAPYFPRSFDRTPRNPAEKLSSGYKAWELLLYFYGLGPGLFEGLLPERYYLHYCKLVVAIRIMYQRRISNRQLILANKFLLEWVFEFEHLYYQQKTTRLHFVRQCVHSLIHLGPEATRLGPPSLSAQWTMERMIGVFGSLLRQPSNIFSNLREQARRVAEINAVVAMWPEIEPERGELQGSLNLGQGYVLLPPKDSKPYRLSSTEQTALDTFYSGLPIPEHTRTTSIYQWGRLDIPTEQTARSFWKEVDRTSSAARTDRNLKVFDLIRLLLMFRLF